MTAFTIYELQNGIVVKLTEVTTGKELLVVFADFANFAGFTDACYKFIEEYMGKRDVEIVSGKLLREVNEIVMRKMSE